MDPREQQDALRKLLETWQPGEPSSELDRRAMQSFHAVTGAPQSKTAWRQRVRWRYGAVAAFMATGVMVAVWLAPPARRMYPRRCGWIRCSSARRRERLTTRRWIHRRFALWRTRRSW